MANVPPGAQRAPRRKPSAKVYRRRRLVALVGALVILALVIFGISRCASSSAAPAPTPTKTATATPTPTSSLIPLTGSGTTASPGATATPTPTPTPTMAQYTGSAKECKPSVLQVGAFTDKDGYNAGELPQLTMTIKNTSTKECKVNVGTSQQVYQITSGDDVWWKSTDCQTSKEDFWMLLKPGKTEKTSAPISWVRERSTPDTCNEARDAAIGGGASYYLTTYLGTVKSADSKQFLLY